MNLWGKRKTENRPLRRGVARAAIECASHEELAREAIQVLRQGSEADRIGVWLEPQTREEEEDERASSFRGVIWDKQVEATPPEWARLSPEFPLPQELLRGKAAEQKLDGLKERAFLGPLIEMRRALWVAIARGERLRGVILAATRTKQAALPKGVFESVAAELLLAAELEEEQRTARERRTDLLLVRQMLAELENGTPEDSVLAAIVEDCIKTRIQDNGPGAVFAGIGMKSAETAPDMGRMTFPWKTGESTWADALENEPLARVWRQALGDRRVVGSEAQSSASGGRVGRLVALPLEAGGEVLGVLVAGLRKGSGSLATLERLELRASLAANVLARKKRIVEDQRRSARQREALESSRTAALLLTSGGHIAALSRGARELLGVPPGNGAQEHSPKNLETRIAAPVAGDFAGLFSSRERERATAWAKRISRETAAGQSPGEESSEFVLSSGQRVRVRMVLPAGGELAAVMLDSVKSEKESDAERIETEFQSVLEWLEEGVVLFDTNNGIRAMNSRFAQIAGLTPPEAAEIKSLDALIDRLKGGADDPDSFAARWRELACMSEGGALDELRLARPIPRVMDRAARPVLDAAGRRLGRVEIYRDETARHVFQSKLLQTEKLVALGQMVTGVSHELSNPLTSILGYAQRLLVSDKVADRREVRQIYEEAERARIILRQLLLTARDARPERRTVSINQVALRVMELQRFGLAAEKIRVEIDLDPVLPFVHGDPGQLQQVLINLLGNAQQSIAESQKGGKIRVRTKRTGEGRVLLEVSDDGPGIPEAILSRIFDPFFTTKPEGVGTGLGLAIVLGVVREHGGHVHVSSPPGGGAIFRIELPAAAHVLADVHTRPEATSHALPEEVHTERRIESQLPRSSAGDGAARVLVVEDEPIVARLIADVLEDEGMSAEVLLDSREALERAAREQYDLVICDMKMPGMNGQYFYNILERTGNPLRERFLFVTGDVVAAHTQQFLERHQLPHVAKPFRVEELTEKVRQVLQGKTAPAEASRKKAARSG